MMGVRIIGLLLALLALGALAACSGPGRTIGPPDPDFTRLTAQVLSNTGEPLSGLAVRVEGQPTGVTTDAGGNFTLDRNAFPNGVGARHEIALGRNGIVVGMRDVVPATEPNLTIRFGEPTAGTATVNGRVSSEQDGGALSGVELTLFSVEAGVLQTRSQGGSFTFENVPAGHWQLVGFLKDYQPEMAFLGVEDGQTVEVNLTLSPEGSIRPGEGVRVRGTLLDSKSGAPIAGAFISVMADTGYIGIPQPGVWEDVQNFPGGEPGMMPPDMDDGVTNDRSSSMFAPWRHDPQYQETTTAADGSFEFEQDVVGYSLWFSFNAEGYLSGSHYESISEATSDIDVELKLDPIIPTTITGSVVDETGAPVTGAYVEFIFAGQNFGGPMPMDDIALPPMMDLGQWAADGTNTRGDTGAPPPPPMNGGGNSSDGGAGWDDWAEGEAASGGDSGAPDQGSSGPDFDNQMMQRFRWEQQNRGTSSIMPFEGYFSVVTGADGNFSFEDVPAGPYYVFASAYRHDSYNADFTAEEDPQSNDTTIVLPNILVGSVEGVVTDETGAPIPDVLVNATQPNVDPFTYSDGQGRYRIDNVPTGTWTISGYKSGYLTVSHDTEISDNGVAKVNLRLVTYTPPPATLIPFSGRVLDGSSGYDDNGQLLDDAGISGADLVFTPTENRYGSYAQHVRSSNGGHYGASLINQFEYNLLIQAPGFQDLFTRIWVDNSWPNLDFSIWPIGAGPGGGGGWGTRPGNGGTEPWPMPEIDPAPPTG